MGYSWATNVGSVISFALQFVQQSKTCCCWPCVLLLSTTEIIWRKERDAARWRAPARQPREMASHWFQWTFLLHGMLIEHHPTVSPGKKRQLTTKQQNARPQCLTHELSCVATTYYCCHNILLHEALEWNVSHEKNKQEILQKFPSQKTSGNAICLSFSLSCPFWNTICEKWDYHESCDVSTVSSSMLELLDKSNRGGELHQLTRVQKKEENKLPGKKAKSSWHPLLCCWSCTTLFIIFPFLSTFVCTVASCPLSRLSAKTGFSFLLFLFLNFFFLLKKKKNKKQKKRKFFSWKRSCPVDVTNEWEVEEEKGIRFG